MIFLLLIVTKIVLATLLALLFVAAPLAIALWPLPETSWLARTVLQSLIGVLLWPVVWALCFALFAVIGASALTPAGSFGTHLVKPWVSVAALYVAFKAPQLLARQAMLAGLMPSPGRGRDARHGLRARRDARRRRRARGAEGVSGRFAQLGGGRRRARRCATRPTSTSRPGCGSARSRSASGRRSPPPAVAAALFGGYLSPLPTQATIFVSIVGAGLPVAVSYGAMGLEFSVAQFARAGWRYWRQPRRFLAGAGEPTTGYVVARRARRRRARRRRDPRRSEGELLWDV